MMRSKLWFLPTGLRKTASMELILPRRVRLAISVSLSMRHQPTLQLRAEAVAALTSKCAVATPHSGDDPQFLINSQLYKLAEKNVRQERANRYNNNLECETEKEFCPEETDNRHACRDSN